MAEILYKTTQAQGGGDAGQGGAPNDGAKPAEGEVVDAEFSETK
jgi:hypothetical protein